MQYPIARIWAILLIGAVFLHTAVAEDPPVPKDFDKEGTELAIRVENASFEQGDDSPADWLTLSQAPGNAYTWERGNAHTGARCIAIHRTNYEYGRWMSTPIDVAKAGFSFYSLTGYIRTVQNTGQVYLAFAWLNEDGYFVTTSDSPMLEPGDNDWTPVAVHAFPPEGTVALSLWCISNDNDGITWFDDLKLQVTQFPAVGDKSYDQFITTYPTHPLALEAHLMRVKTLMITAKWIRERGFYDPAAQKRASVLYGQAAAVPRNDAVLAKASTAAGKRLEDEQTRFETLIDEALWEAVSTATAANDTDAAFQFIEKIILRNRTAHIVADAQLVLVELKKHQK